MQLTPYDVYVFNNINLKAMEVNTEIQQSDSKGSGNTNQDSGANKDLIRYYLNMADLLCPGASMEASVEIKLGMLYRELKKIIKILNLLSHQPLTTYCSRIQLSSGYYLIAYSIPQQNKENMNDLISQLTLFFCKLIKENDAISNFLKFYSMQLKELDKLIKTDSLKFDEDDCPF